MKILVVSDRFAPFHTGGAARVAAALAHEYRRVGHEVVVVHGDPGGGPPHDGEINGLRAHWLGAPVGKRSHGWLSVRHPHALRQLRRVVAAERPDVAHAHNLHGVFSFAALDVLAAAGVPTVLTLHDCLSFHQGKFVEVAHRPDWRTDDAALRVSAWDLLRRYRFRYVPGRRRRIRAIIERSGACAVSVSRLLRRAVQANRVPCHEVVHNGVRAAAFQSTPHEVETLRTRLGLGGRQVVGVFGRLTRDKGQAQMLAAMRLVREAIPQAVLLAVGTSPSRLPADSPSAVGTETLGGRELAAAYGLADVVVAPSVYLDAFPTVVLEAMAAGKPAVVSCFAGSSEIIESGRTGVVVDPFDVPALAGHVSVLLTDAARAGEIGAAARQLAEDRFTIERCAGRYLELLEQRIRSRTA